MSARPWYHHLIGVFALCHVAMVSTVGLQNISSESGIFGVVGPSWNAFRAQVRSVHGTYGDLLGPKQGWGMFSGVSRHSRQVFIEVELPSGRVPVYVERSAEHTWNRASFDHYRWREMMTQITGKRARKSRIARFVNWVGPAVAADYPRACAVRFTVRISTAPEPDELADGARATLSKARRVRRYDIPGRSCP